MIGGTLIVSKQNRAITRFREAGAFSPASATSLKAAKLRDSFAFRSLLAEGVFRETPTHKFWLDAAGAKAFVVRRRWRLLLAIGIAAILFATVFG